MPGRTTSSSSARAIHHLPAELIASLYASVHGALNPGGVFFNLDTASPETEFINQAMRRARRRDENSPPRELRRTPEQIAPRRDAPSPQRKRSRVTWSGCAPPASPRSSASGRTSHFTLVGGYKGVGGRASTRHSLPRRRESSSLEVGRED